MDRRRRQNREPLAVPDGRTRKRRKSTRFRGGPALLSTPEWVALGRGRTRQIRRQVFARWPAMPPEDSSPACETSTVELAEGVEVDDERLRAFCTAHGIRSLRLFGSAVHGTLEADSDIDLLVEFELGRTPGLLTIAQLELDLGDMLGREIDLRTIQDLSRHFRDRVIEEARSVYGAT